MKHNIFVIAIVMITLIPRLVSPVLTEIGPCDCGIFQSQKLATPFYIQTINYNKCTTISAMMCNELCISLNIGTIDLDVTVICSLIGEGIDIYMKIFSRICEGQWTDTNLSPTDPICCENGIDVPCEEPE